MANLCYWVNKINTFSEEIRADSNGTLQAITGDFDIRIRAALEDWTPGSDNDLLVRGTGGDFAYKVKVLTTGKLRLSWRDSSESDFSADSTVALTLTSYEFAWLRVTLDVDNGSGNYVVTFYTSTDGSTWSQLGNVVTGVTTTSVHDTLKDTCIPSDGQSYTGVAIEYLEIRNGINGSVALLFDPTTDAGAGDTTWTSSSPAGETWVQDLSADTSGVTYTGDTTVTLNAAGGADYTSFFAAEADSALGFGIYKINITGAADYTWDRIDAAIGTGTSTSYVWVTVDPSVRHNGVFTDPANTATNVRGGSDLQIFERYTRVEWLELNSDAIGCKMSVYNSFPYGAESVVSRCIITNAQNNNFGGDRPLTIIDSSTAGVGGENFYADNCIFYRSSEEGAIWIQNNWIPTTQYFDHCAILEGSRQDDEGHFAQGIRYKSNVGLNSRLTLYNCVMGGTLTSGRRDYSAGASDLVANGTSAITDAGSHNAFDDNTPSNNSGGFTNTVAISSTGSLTTDTTITNAYIVNSLSKQAENLELVAGTTGSNPLIGGGTNRQGSEPEPRQDFSTDVRGAKRSTKTGKVDIGPFQVTTDAGFQYWNGSTWADSVSVKYYNGTAWADVTAVKYWNGSTWADPV